MQNNQEFEAVAWGVQERPSEVLTLPSGQKCRVRKIDMEEIMASGLIDALDTFSPGMLDDGKKKPQDRKKSKAALEKEERSALQDILRDQEKLNKLTETMNKVLVICVMSPKIHELPVADKDGEVTKVPGMVYVDQVGFFDKMEIFSHVMDLDSMSGFPGGEKDGVGDMAEKPSVPNVSVGDAGS